MLYSIIRLYNSDECCLRRRKIKSGLTLKEAREHCDGTEGFFATAKKSAAKARTKKLGAWVDVYVKEGGSWRSAKSQRAAVRTSEGTSGSAFSLSSALH